MKNILHPESNEIRSGDLVQFLGESNKQFVLKVASGKQTQTHLGVIEHDKLIGLQWGSQIKTHIGKMLVLVQPSLDDLLREIDRTTQIMYPKDIGYVILSLGIGPGTTIIEAGSGSGALTTVLAYLVGTEGKVYSYDQKEKHQRFAKRNLKHFDLAERVEFKIKNVEDGFDETGVNALFLDLPNPVNCIQSARSALLPGGHFGCILPTTNQVSDLITELKKNNFSKIEVSEIFHRYFKPTATRLRPDDKMVGHTGFLVFARKINPYTES